MHPDSLRQQSTLAAVLTRRGKLKEAESKYKKQESNKKNAEKLEQVQKKLHSLQLEKDHVEETNKQILA